MRAYSNARIGGVLKRVEADPDPAAGIPWKNGVIDALRWVLRADVPSIDRYQQEYDAEAKEMDREKFEAYLGFPLSDEEYDSLRARAVESGRWR